MLKINEDLHIKRRGDDWIVEIRSSKLNDFLKEWKEIRKKVKMDNMSEKEYLEWKCCWPDTDTERT